jgi:hypothetical protein
MGNIGLETAILDTSCPEFRNTVTGRSGLIVVVQISGIQLLIALEV